ncbi:MAG TPA: hypothetical protein PLT27_09775 [Nitrospira sp.]|nr:hypothetical protein [Nitrospira sp.]
MTMVRLGDDIQTCGGAIFFTGAPVTTLNAQAERKPIDVALEEGVLVVLLIHPGGPPARRT